MSVNETSYGAVTEQRSGEQRASEIRARKRSRREFAAAWLVGGTIWLAGLGGLALAQEIRPAHPPGVLASGSTGSTAYYRLDSLLSPVQDITGRYTVVVRSLSRVVSR